MFDHRCFYYEVFTQGGMPMSSNPEARRITLRSILSSLAVVVITAMPVASALTTVITAVPTTRCYTSADSASCAPVPRSQAQGLRMTLMKDDDSGSMYPDYFWVIDGRPREVERGSIYGTVVTFTDPSGGGMVVVHKIGGQVKPPGQRSDNASKPHLLRRGQHF